MEKSVEEINRSLGFARDDKRTPWMTEVPVILDYMIKRKMGRPDRAAPERQRGFREGTEAVEVPVERSGAACPTGAVTVGDWG